MHVHHITACLWPLLKQTPTASLLYEMYLCLPYSQQVEVLRFCHLSCGSSLDGAPRTSWRQSWRGGGYPGWCSEPPRWLGCQQKGRGPGTRGHCCTQSLWRCRESPGAPPAASSHVCSAGWRRAFSCGEEGYTEEDEKTRRKGGRWVVVEIGTAWCHLRLS